ncbi:hypothetical protein RclHR1_02290011 [Rhizophagus clarus]|uniref:Uncharacterized protein n=1 Tax=Rhizophagus clarus TaxID=94130 RepID=A0A2Z6QX06_9GLOM|nr:hypothetical protein RclHR1_02290011 [Rhizophagus clarus]GES83033.1 hypothetical protein GLOIN_2v1645667 [Rhizophagus clarus]
MQIPNIQVTDIPPNFRNKFSQEVSCYALPYGFFGIISWSLAFITIFLTYANIPLFSCWRWRKPYRSQGPIIAVISSAMVVLPAIYTCIKCDGNWEIILIALGQLTPWSFKMLNDGTLARSREIFFVHPRDTCYYYFGMFLTILLCISGWCGISKLSIDLMEVQGSLTWPFITCSVAVLFFSLMLVINCEQCGNYNQVFRMMSKYFFATLHSVISHVIISLVSGQWIGIPSKGLLVFISSIVFFVGKRLLFFDIGSC